MRTLTNAENKEVSAAYASISMGGGMIILETTGTSVNSQMGTLNGMKIGLTFYSDHVDDANNNVVFKGTSGSFCYGGNSYQVLPVTGGSRVVINKGC